MATYIGKVTITMGVRVDARSLEEAETRVLEASFGRISTGQDRVSEYSYEKMVALHARED